MKTDINKYREFVAFLESLILECKPGAVIGTNGGFEFTIPNNSIRLRMDFDAGYIIKIINYETTDMEYTMLPDDYNKIFTLFMTHIVFKKERYTYDIPQYLKTKSFIRNEKIDSLDK